MPGASAVEYTQTSYVFYLIRICQTAGQILILYDHALSFGREVDYIWNYTFGFGTIYYLIIRYVGDTLAILNTITFVGRLVQTSQLLSHFSQGKTYFFIQSYPGILVLFLIQLVLQLRLYALYQQSKKILAFMLFGYICEIAAMSTIIGIIGAGSQVMTELIPGLYVCTEVNGSSIYHLYILWLPVIIYEVILCLLALWVGVKDLQSSLRARPMDGVYITRALVKGNTGYFFCILLACAMNLAIGQHLGVQWVWVSEGYPATIEVVMGCRLILSLRSSLAQNHNNDSEDVAERTMLIEAETPRFLPGVASCEQEIIPLPRVVVGDGRSSFQSSTGEDI